jgi:tetratricopeptide (TPR) repeat protein
MRSVNILLAGTALAIAGGARAADELKFGKPPAWVVPQPIPASSDKTASAPVALLLTDQQIQLRLGEVVTYSEMALKIQKPEGLSAGNLSIPWNPATDTVTVNKLEIHRGNQVIDVLARGQKFTTMRRETALEAAMLNGNLTANIQPEGLQEGDIIDLATTIQHADPLMGNHVEANFAVWPPLPIGRAHVRLEWPGSLALNVKGKGVTLQPLVRGTFKVLEITSQDVQPIIAPNGAPPRFAITRLGEATDFSSWSNAAELIEPFYRKAASISPTGSLNDEVQKIRTSSVDPKVQAEMALQLVQDRTRYVALLMDEGGYLPADAETTWSRRFGDCKAKTALLLAILHALGISAEPILVQSKLGDALNERLPMLSYFDHVLVRAHIGGKTYYLDGTRTGDEAIDQIPVPDFGWALPLTDKAQLVQLVPSPLDRPQSESKVAIDASAGVYAAAEVSADQTIRGDLAVVFESGLSSLTEAQRKEFFDNYWKKSIDDVTPGPSTFAFDKAAREMRLSMKGKLKLDWTGGFFHLPLSSIGYSPDLDRSDGPAHDAPYSIEYPTFTMVQTKVRFPIGFFSANVEKLVPPPLHKTLIGVEYSRAQSATRESMTVETAARSLVPEVSYKEAIAGRDALKGLADGDVAVRLPSTYRATSADLPELKVATGSASDLATRGSILMEGGYFPEAIASFSKALELEPKNVVALSNRAIAYSWIDKFDFAKKDVEATLSIDPANGVALRARGLTAERSKDCARAVEAYTASLQFQTQNPFALGHRAICEASLSKYDDALADSALALKLDPSWMDLRILRANIFARQGRNDEVAAEAKLLTTENPTSSFAFVGAGRMYGRLRRTADAMKAFDAALAIKPEAFIYLNRAQARPFTDKAGRLADLDAALKLDPKNPDAIAEKAEQLAADGHYKGARQLYDDAIKAAPDEDYYRLRRAVLTFKLGDTDEARKAFQEFRADAKSASELNRLCWAKATAGILLDSALEDCREALKREQDTGAYLDSLALVELRLGSVDAAIADYSRAISRNIPASYMGRALAFARKGDKVRAAADLAQALRLDPDAQTRFEEFGLKMDQSGAGE